MTSVERAKAWREKNRERYNAYFQTEKHLTYRRNWAKNNREKKRASDFRYHARERIKRKTAQQKAVIAFIQTGGLSRWIARYWLQAFKKRCARKEYIKRWSKEKRATDLSFRLLGSLRQSIARALNGRATKSARTVCLLGCTVPEFKTHLEKQFESWMTWENYGKEWEIDHIRSCATFDLTSPTQQRRCFHFSNQRPLRVFTNRSEGVRCG